jgi:gliding motility-associated-like protein
MNSARTFSHFLFLGKFFITEKAIVLFFLVTLQSNLTHLHAQSGCGSSCNNAGFEDGGTEPPAWVGAYGRDADFAACTSPNPCNLTNGWDTRPASRIQFDQHVITTAGTSDVYTGLPTVPSGGGNYAFRLGDLTASDASAVNGNYSGEAARASLTFTVTAANANFVYRYAVVLEDPPFPNDLYDIQRPYFQATLKDASGNALSCGSLKITAKKPYPGLKKIFIQGGGATDNHDQYLYYSDWSTVLIPLQQYIGQCITIEFTTSDAANGKYLGYAYIDADCSQPLQINKYIPKCRTYGILSAPEGASIYDWKYITSYDTTAIGGAPNNQTIVAYKTGTYQVSITPFAGNVCNTILNIYVDLPDTIPTILPLKDFILCSSANFQGVDFGVKPTNSTVKWKNTNPSIGLADSGVGNINPFVLTNPTAQIQKATINIKAQLGFCEGGIDSFIVYVLPQNAIDPTLDTLNLCSGNAVRGISFIANNPPVTWINTNPTIGLPGSGQDFTPTFTAQNPEEFPIQSNIIFNIPAGPTTGCTVDTKVIYPLTVKPTPSLTKINDITVCAGDTVPAINFSVYPRSAVFNWTNSNSNIGLPDTGRNNINAFAAASISNFPVTSTIVNSPSLNGCTGPSSSFNITVNPLPNVDLGPDIKVREDSTYTLIATTTPNVLLYNWSPPEKLNCTDCPAPVFNPARDSIFSVGVDSMAYTLLVTSDNGCKRSDIIIVRIIYIPCQKGAVFIPTVFTPNNDGVNDVFLIQGTGSGKVRQLSIFDRWGGKLFEKKNFRINDRNAGWNGRSGGQISSPNGSYVYVAIVECDTGNPITLKGTITLLR